MRFSTLFYYNLFSLNKKNLYRKILLNQIQRILERLSFSKIKKVLKRDLAAKHFTNLGDPTRYEHHWMLNESFHLPLSNVQIVFKLCHCFVFSITQRKSAIRNIKIIIEFCICAPNYKDSSNIQCLKPPYILHVLIQMPNSN